MLVLPAQAQNVDSRLQEALRLERSMGDYEGAISIYRDIAGDAGADRRVTAQALIQLGKAYESLGRTEAFDAYQRVARDFSDQQDLVAEARERMAGLASEQAPANGPERVGPLGVRASLLEWPVYLNYSSLSPDGRYFHAPEWIDGQSYATVQDLETDQVELIVIGADTLGANVPSLFSGDSRYMILAVWAPVENSFMTVEVFDRTTRSSRTLMDHAAMADYNWAEPYDWTSDGSGVLVGLGPTKDSYLMDFVVVDFESGAIRKSARLEEEHAWSSGKPCLMDDRYVLYNSKFMERWEVRRLDLDTGTDGAFLETESGTRLLGCSQHHSAALVMNDEYGDFEARIYRLEDALPVGAPAHVEGVLPDALALGMTSDGTLMYRDWKMTPATGIVLPYEPATGRPVGEGAKKPNSDWARPAWSRNGERFSVSASRKRLYIEEADGSSRITRIKTGDPVVGYSWTPDGAQFIIAPMQSVDARPITFRMDPDRMAVVDTLAGIVGRPGRSGRSILAAEMTEDGKLCLNEFPGGLSSKTTVGCFAYESEWTVHTAAFSPDASRVLITGHGSSRMEQELGLIELSTGEVRMLENGIRTSEQVPPYLDADWLPDSSGLVGWGYAGYLVHIALDGTASPWMAEFTDTRFVYGFNLHPRDNRVYVMSRLRKSLESKIEEPAYWVSENVWKGID